MKPYLWKRVIDFFHLKQESRFFLLQCWYLANFFQNAFLLVILSRIQQIKKFSRRKNSPDNFQEFLVTMLSARPWEWSFFQFLTKKTKMILSQIYFFLAFFRLQGKKNAIWHCNVLKTNFISMKKNAFSSDMFLIFSESLYKSLSLSLKSRQIQSEKMIYFGWD